ncbi:DUF3344 domain-containing protein [Streptomyces naganishii]|uniref:DUF3344 domain-containing protein n=1 Tax=Streptomyces naganishii TaxID=285447 RepID=UPI0036973FE0
MTHVDVDDDPSTHGSSRAGLRPPPDARAAYEHPYWDGNLRAGEQRPAAEDARVLFAEPGGQYEEVLADTAAGHRVARGADAREAASADVTRLVPASGGGLCAVARADAAKGRTAGGAWGGRTPAAAHGRAASRRAAEPLRRVALRDGFSVPDSRAGQRVRPRGPAFRAGSGGRVGRVAYDGDRGVRGDRGDSLTVTAERAGASGRGRPWRARPAPTRTSVLLTGPGDPGDGVLNSTIAEPGTAPAARVPACAGTPGHDSDGSGLGPAPAYSGDRPAFRPVSPPDTPWAGVPFAAVGAGR